jgi:hypothetical protein
MYEKEGVNRNRVCGRVSSVFWSKKHEQLR